MSLINDALKRASQTAPAPAARGRSPQPEQAARAAEKPQPSGPWPVFVFPIGLVLVLALASWMFLRSWDPSSGLSMPGKRMKASARQSADTPAKDQTGSEKPVVLPGSSKSASPSNASAAPAEVANAQTAVAAPAPVEPPLADEPPPPPSDKLQGIFYRPARPLAMINGRTVGVGDQVLAGRVASIERDRVIIQVGAEYKVLILQGKNSYIFAPPPAGGANHEFTFQ